jgi:hypothetical protein
MLKIPTIGLNPTSNAQLLAQVPLASLLQRLPGVVFLLFVPFCILGPIYTPTFFAVYFVFLGILFFAQVIRSMYANRIAYQRVQEHSKTNWQEKYCGKVGVTSIEDTRHDLPYDAVRHTIIIPQYKEDLGTMVDTLDVLASHPMALSHYKVSFFLIVRFVSPWKKAKRRRRKRRKPLSKSIMKRFMILL